MAGWHVDNRSAIRSIGPVRLDYIHAPLSASRRRWGDRRCLELHDRPGILSSGECAQPDCLWPALDAAIAGGEQRVFSGGYQSLSEAGSVERAADSLCTARQFEVCISLGCAGLIGDDCPAVEVDGFDFARLSGRQSK